MAKFKYCILHDKDDQGEPDYSFESDWDEEDPEWLAEDAATNFHHDHDGWEYSWPVMFAIFTEDGKPLGRYEIEREFDPDFSASSLPETP